MFLYKCRAKAGNSIFPQTLLTFVDKYIFFCMQISCNWQSYFLKTGKETQAVKSPSFIPWEHILCLCFSDLRLTVEGGFMNNQELDFQEKGDVLNPGRQQWKWTLSENNEQFVARNKCHFKNWRPRQTSDKNCGDKMYPAPETKRENEKHFIKTSGEEIKQTTPTSWEGPRR